MNEQEFKKNLANFKNVQMTHEEKARVLEKVFQTPLPSPYVRVSTFFSPALALVRVRAWTTLTLVLCLSFGGLAYASNYSLPGETLYQMKVGLVEPILDQLYSSVEKKIVWEEEKVERRIREAEALLERSELDDAISQDLERRVEKSSRAFAEAVEALDREKRADGAQSLEVESEIEEGEEEEEEVEDEVETRKREFRQRISPKVESSSVLEDESSVESAKEKHGEQKEKVERLKRKALEALED